MEIQYIKLPLMYMIIEITLETSQLNVAICPINIYLFSQMGFSEFLAVFITHKHIKNGFSWENSSGHSKAWKQI